MKEIIKTIEEISSQMEREWWSKAFVANWCVNAWKEKIDALKTQINESWVVIEKKYERDWLEFCSTCNQKVSLKRRRIERWMITGLLKAIHYCRSTWKKTFEKKDVKLTNVEYSIFSFLVKFWLLYKRDDMWVWEYWIPFKICAEFFHGQRSVLEYYEIDPTKQKWEKGHKVNSESRVFFKDIPKHSELVKQFPSTIEYLWNTNF